MSVQAVAWALDHRQTGGLHPATRLTLVALADYARPDGSAAFPAAGTLAELLGVDVRHVRRHLADLQEAGLIRRGDQELVAHYRRDRRPTVWDLALDGIQTLIVATGETVSIGAEPYDRNRHGVTEVSPREPVDNRSARGGESVTPTGHGVAKSAPHGVTLSPPNPITNPNTSTPLGHLGDHSARELATASATTPCPSCGRPVGQSHRCPGAEPRHPMPPGFRDEVHAQVEAAHPPIEQPPLIPDDEQAAPPPACEQCATTDRPLVADGLCRRCLMAAYQDDFDDAQPDQETHAG